MPTNSVYWKEETTGGAANALDGVNGNKLFPGDKAFIHATTQFLPYLLSTDGSTEAPPDVITPDVNSSSWAWKRKSVYSSGVSGLTFFSRGQVTTGDGFDWYSSDFTLDGTWRELEISSTVGISSDARWVDFYLRYTTTSANGVFGLIENGTTGFNRDMVITQVGLQGMNASLSVGCDTDQKVKYYGIGGSSFAQLLVKGWYE